MRFRKLPRILLVPALFLALAVSPQLGIPHKVAGTANYNIAILNESFNPPSRIVHTGDTVVWSNQDPFLYELYFQNPDGSQMALSPYLQPGDTYSLSFNTCTTIQYMTLNSPVTITGTVKVLIQGDVNGDGKVNIFDLTQVGSEFGSRVGDANYNASADLDQSGVINIFDLTLVGSNFGSICT
jgi:plastocyanin